MHASDSSVVLVVSHIAKRSYLIGCWRDLYCLARWLRRLGAGLADREGSATCKSVFWRRAPNAKPGLADVAQAGRMAEDCHGAHAHARLRPAARAAASAAPARESEPAAATLPADA
ncbi:unnamed protein product, partial [Iphiclides podalirius]